MRLRFIEDHRTVWPVPVMCGVLQVSPSGYHVRRTPWFDAWRSRPEGKRAAENRMLLDEIRTAHAASQGRYGTPSCMQRCGPAEERWAGAASSA